MVESKAYEKLGILRPKRTFAGFFKSVLVVVALGACVWGAIRIFSRQESVADVDRNVENDDGSLYLNEHLVVQCIPHVDIRTREIDNRMVTVTRQYWFKLTIDERWYFNCFVPAVKKFIAEIAPAAETSSVTLDTKDLAYSNDGADRLQRMSSTFVFGDAFDWNASRSTGRLERSRRKYRSVLLLDGVKDSGAVTCATTYRLDNAQFDKFENWVKQNVLRARTGISVSLTNGDQEIASGQWTAAQIHPTGFVRFQNEPQYAVSPWINVTQGVRCNFLGIRATRRDGVPDAVSQHWNL